MEWDSDDMLFLIENNDKILKELERDGYRMHPLVPEIIVWGRGLDFKTTYIARKEDFDYLEMFWLNLKNNGLVDITLHFGIR